MSLKHQPRAIDPNGPAWGVPPNGTLTWSAYRIDAGKDYLRLTGRNERGVDMSEFPLAELTTEPDFYKRFGPGTYQIRWFGIGTSGKRKPNGTSRMFGLGKPEGHDEVPHAVAGASSPAPPSSAAAPAPSATPLQTANELVALFGPDMGRQLAQLDLLEDRARRRRADEEEASSRREEKRAEADDRRFRLMLELVQGQRKDEAIEKHLGAVAGALKMVAEQGAATATAVAALATRMAELEGLEEEEEEEEEEEDENEAGGGEGGTRATVTIGEDDGVGDVMKKTAMAAVVEHGGPLVRKAGEAAVDLLAELAAEKRMRREKEERTAPPSASARNGAAAKAREDERIEVEEAELPGVG